MLLPTLDIKKRAPIQSGTEHKFLSFKFDSVLVSTKNFLETWDFASFFYFNDFLFIFLLSGNLDSYMTKNMV